MSINKLMTELKANGKKAFIPYITAGDPNLEATELFVKKLVEAGADIIELGIPFSDPVADGVVNQRSAERALKNHVSLTQILDFVANLRKKAINIPIVIFTYFNPVLKMGIESFAKKAQECKVDATLVLDLPPEAGKEYKKILDKYQIETIFLASPTTTKDRLELIDEMSSGFVYYVARTGVTGAQKDISVTLEDEISEVKKLITKPIAIGFGISNREQADKIAQYADGIIVGSAIVRLIENNDDVKIVGQDIYEFVTSLIK